MTVGQPQPPAEESGVIETQARIRQLEHEIAGLRASLPPEFSPEPLETGAWFGHAILESSRDCIKLIGLDGRLEFMNVPGRQALGIEDFAAFRGRRWEELWPLEKDRLSVAAAVSAASQGQVGRFQGFFPTLQGEPKWWHVVVTPVCGPAGEPVRLLAVSRDISERKRSEEAVRSRERHVRGVLDSLFALVGVYTTDGFLIDANRAALEAVGRPLQELTGKRLWESDWCADLPLTQTKLRAAFEQACAGSQTRFDTEVRISPDSVMPIDFMLAPLRDAAGSITHLIASAVDISDRKQVESALLSSKERLELAQEATSVGFFDWDVLADTSVCSPAWLRTYGFAENQSPTHTDWLRSIHPDDRAQAQARALAAAQDGRSYQDDFRVVWPDGSVHWVTSAGRTLFNSEGKPWRFLGAALDITARKEAELELRRSEERFRGIVEAVPGMVFIADPAGHNIFINGRFQEYTGRPAEGLLGDSWAEIIHPDDLAHNVAHWRTCISEVRPYEIEHRFRRWDGSYRWMLTRALPLRDEAGQVRRWLGSSTDIEDQKRTEKMLRSMVDNLEQYAYVASHDLQEPLRTVAAFTQMLERKYKGQLDETAGKYIGFIIEAANRMQNLIEDLLSFSRVTKDSERTLEEVDLGLVCEEVRNTLLARIAESNAIVVYENLPTVMGDSRSLAQVMQNLISNALKYHQPGVAPVVKVSARRRGSDWCIAVEDNGIGFEPQHAERIFGIFKRLHGSEVPGTGIGLAIVRTIIERHSGHIWASSQGPGKGATFTFTLPVWEGHV